MVEPAGLFSLPMKYLRDALAQSSNFQAWVEADNATEALESIHLVKISGSSYTRPFALIDFGEDYDRFREAGGNVSHFVPSGSLLLMFEMDVASENEDSWQDACLAFTNTVGAIIADIEALSGQAGYLNIKHWELKKLQRSLEDEEITEGDYYMMIIEAEWDSA
jgi:hypothetical protein